MTEPRGAARSLRLRPTSSWRKSTFSGAGGDCVELAAVGSQIAVRHSRRPDEEVLLYSRSELAAFIAGCKAGEFDDLVT